MQDTGLRLDSCKKVSVRKTKIGDNYFRLKETNNQMKGMNFDQVRIRGRSKRHLGEQLGNFKYELNIRDYGITSNFLKYNNDVVII